MRETRIPGTFQFRITSATSETVSKVFESEFQPTGSSIFVIPRLAPQPMRLHANLKGPSTHTVALHAIELTVVYAEMSSLHSATFDRLEEYGPEFQKLLARGQFVHAADYLHCLRARHLVQLDFQRVFESVDAVIVPGCVCVAPRHDNMVAKIGSQEIPLLDVISRTTAVFDIVGLPSITVPSGFDNQGLPMAVGIATRPYDEATCLRLGHTYQQLTSHHTALPSITRRDSEASHPPDERTEWPAVVEKPIITSIRDGIW
jgi:Asp-tRNA(Asn)/Glu-tRNA(Gln) amidotransferase A subunit family amidase